MGQNNARYVLRGGAVMSMDKNVGDFPVGDVLVQGKKILAVGKNLQAGSAIEAHNDLRCRGGMLMISRLM